MSDFTHAIILDFESTCDDQKPIQPQEIIEFPSVVLDLKTLQITAEYESFVRPVHHPELTPFCRELTSITQSDVSRAKPFAEVFEEHQRWLAEHNLFLDNALFVTCGDWDLNVMLPTQCAVSSTQIPKIPGIYRRWHNIKRSYVEVMNVKKAPGMAKMLKGLDIQLTGHHHRGIDDCRNITTLLKTVLEQGAQFRVTGER
jgi:inhibitor of KinA sporulation pathway (predicted exonuclease)